LIAANNLLKAIKLMDRPPKVDLAVSKELTVVRDLNEHWVENMPIFNVQPKPRDLGYPPRATSSPSAMNGTIPTAGGPGTANAGRYRLTAQNMKVISFSVECLYTG
jgi:hypothetical protein